MQRYRLHALVAAAYLGTFLASLDISIVNVGLPTLQSALNADLAGLQWIVNVYAVALSAVMLSAGPLGDRYGHKRVWLGSVLVFVLGSIICAVAGKLDTLLWGRAIQGIAGALLIPGAMPILTHAFPDPHKRARAIGGWSACNALALISGPLLGGLLIEHVGWESIFLVNVPVGIAAALLGAWGIVERKHPDHAAFDPAGQALSMLWLGMLSYGLIEIGEHGAAPNKVLLPLGIAAAGFIVFVWVELRVKRPLFPIQLFHNRSLALANLASFALGFSAYSSLFFLSLFLQQAHGSSPAIAGWQLMPQFTVMAMASLLFGRLAARFSLKLLMVAGYALVGLALCSMAIFNPSTPFVTIGVVLAILGLGMGLSVPATGMMVMGYAPPERAGIASATMNALRQIGMTMGIAMLGSAMSILAVREMTRAARATGASDAADLARNAVVHHVFSTTQTGILDLYRASMADGFALVMVCAGVACLSVAFLLFFFHVERILPKGISTED
ncbi:DHA2 family efflux MFS transporter permease subunit [Achromobacter marplatensis]|uniref:DHA2 family efflux MFS transporter permease subunit n=1 Tax=Achromobacter marplatensis TaxID=470868 RepID=UPI0028F14F6C|nr:DHA2 family efflux MFS transporter permease subunit [Achromobacter marplatensis]